MFKKLTYLECEKWDIGKKMYYTEKGNNHFLFSMKKILLDLSLETSLTINLEGEEGVIQNVLMA